MKKLGFYFGLLLIVTLLTATAGFGKEKVHGSITWWTPWAEDQGPQEIIEAFNKDYPEIKVEHVKFTNTDEGNVKIDMTLLAGQNIDVFFNFAASRLIPRVQRGLLQDLSGFIAKDKFNVETNLGKGIYRYNNKYYALPVGSLTNSVYINEKMLKAAKIKTPKEWSMEQYKEFAKALTKGEGAKKVYGACDFHSVYYWTMPARGLIGSDAWYNAQGMSNFDFPAYKRALQYKYDMENIERTQFPYSEMKFTKMQAWDVFMQQRSAMVVASNAIARLINDTNKYPRDYKVTVAPLPTLDKNQKQNYNKGLYYFDYLGMNAQTKNKQAAWTFMKWLATDGSIYLAKVGHLPTWKKANKDAVVKILFGADAESKIDIDAFKRVVLDYESPCYNDIEVTAYSQIYSIIQEEAEKVLFDTGVTVDQAISNMKKRSDEAIAKERGK